MSTPEKLRRAIRRRRVRSGLDKHLPRLTIFRSHKHMWAQIIDDQKGMTLASASSKTNTGEGSKIAIARRVGQVIAQTALKNKIGRVVFDRGSYRYHGRVKAFAEGAREGGLQF